ncbi:ankyrin repeat, SAM and basic leucine zipper domain-containing protein 1-like isoform X1 [Rhopalosiphum maidis]|uniref:ankyrin repeat, SAM and basic leucine zipper domain-containing protein 1-like isoform X1 n=2 Tax=Rhopalosiphum maidis TaxID=43146 RepID=UPI000EFDFF03|nr:ankyrin repeat, SAM and basic leucine zipper domain-containing protein 1-like isoform X1 [Rhopalosiphum maidis]
MFTAFGCTDMTFIFNFYYQSMCPAFNIDIQKSEQIFRKQKPKTVPISVNMKFEKNIFPAEWESDSDEYDEFGDIIERKSYNVRPEVEDFQLTLINACTTNNVPEITRALNSGTVNINSYLNNNWTVLMNAAFYGSLDAVIYLLQNGADPLIEYDCHNVIMCVCNCSRISNELDLLNCLKHLANVDGIDINSKDRTGLTALMYACSNGWLKLVEFLVDHGADIEMKDNQSGETALFFAVRNNHVNIVKFLLSKGADKDVTDKKCQTVFRIAENKNMVDILNLLNSDYKNAQLEVYYSEEEHPYWDEVMTELENGFSKDIKSFLEVLSMDIYTDQLISNNITFKNLLSGNNDQFVNMGITLSPHRKLLATALKCFHTWNWSNYSLDIKKNDMNVERIAQILGMIVRQLHILDASIKYLGTHSYGLDQQKGQEAINYLKRIRILENKIFKILDQKIRMGQVDYTGYKKRNRNIKKNLDKLFAGTAVILLLLRIF